MLQSFLNKYCKQVFLDLSLMVKMSLSDQRDMHDSLQLSWHLMIFKLFVVDFYLENPRWRIRDRFSVRTPQQYYPQRFNTERCFFFPEVEGFTAADLFTALTLFNQVQYVY